MMYGSIDGPPYNNMYNLLNYEKKKTVIVQRFINFVAIQTERR